MENVFRKEKLNQNSSNLDLFLKEIFLKTNQDLQKEVIPSVKFSGSTCISVIYTDKKLICANIGDSRAVMGRCANKEWICYELSIDHKPTDPNEAKRIIKAGGRVEPFKDENGNSIGPSRIWLKDEMVPGLAMTRSFGDTVAREVGVTSEPASDGLWEFMESEEVVDIVSKFYNEKDYKGAMDFLMEESHSRWIEKEEIVDDTTIILVFFE